MNTKRLEVEPGRFVDLVKVSPTLYRGMSPFVEERTPSFFLDTARNSWNDFASGKSGQLQEAQT